MKETNQRKKIKDIIFKMFAIILITSFTGIKNAVIIFLILMLFYVVYEIIWNNIKWGQLSCESCVVDGDFTFKHNNDQNKNEDSVKF